MSLTEDEYAVFNLKRLELEEVQLNYDLFKIDEQLKNLETKYKKLQDEEKFVLIQEFQDKLINLEILELEIADLKNQYGIEDEKDLDEDYELEDSADESNSSILDTTSNIINKLQNGE